MLAVPYGDSEVSTFFIAYLKSPLCPVLTMNSASDISIIPTKGPVPVRVKVFYMTDYRGLCPSGDLSPRDKYHLLPSV